MIVVVGGRGVIGRPVVEALRAADHDVVVVSHDPKVEGGKVRYGDMLRPETLRPAVRGADVVVQSANFPNYPMERPRRGWTFQAFDRFGTERLLDAATKEGVRRFIFVGGCGAVPDDNRPYLKAIWQGEQAVLGSTMEKVCVEPTLVFGPTDHGLNRVLRLARRVPVLPLPGGYQLHQPIFADDLAALIVHAAGPDAPEGCFPIGGPDRMTMEQMVRVLMKVAGISRPVVRFPMSAFVPLGSVLGHAPGAPLTRHGAEFLGEDFIADNTAVLAQFPLPLTGFEDGLRRYI